MKPSTRAVQPAPAALPGERLRPARGTARPRRAQGREQGSAAIITVLMTGMTLAAVIAVTTQVSLGARRSAADDAASARLLMAAESGMAGFLDRTRRSGVGFTGVTNAATMNAAFARNSFGTGDTLAGFAVPGATVAVRVNKTVPATFTSIKELIALDVTSTATSGSDRSSVTQRFTVNQGNLPKLNIPGAVTSYPGVDLNGNASIGGATLSSPDSAVYGSYLTLKRKDAISVVKGTPMVMDTSGSDSARLRSLEPGTYVRMPLVSSITGIPLVGAPTGLFRVEAKDIAAQTITLTPTSLPSSLLTPYVPTSTGADLIRNALLSVSATGMTVANSETFIQGDSVSITLSGVTYAAKVSATPVKGASTTTLSLNNWTPSTPTSLALASFGEGQPVSKSTLGVVTAGAFSPGKTTPVGGVLPYAGSTIIPSPLNNTLFNQTFGTSPEDLKALATVMTEDQFSASPIPINGITWLTSTDHAFNLNNEKITGKGILVVDGDLTVNQNQSGACNMNGVLYVRGNLRIQGNLEVCGAIVVEGSVLDGNNNVVAIDTTASEFLGTGRKIQYDPNVLFDITQGTGKVSFTTVAGSWRQQ